MYFFLRCIALYAVMVKKFSCVNPQAVSGYIEILITRQFLEMYFRYRELSLTVFKSFRSYCAVCLELICGAGTVEKVGACIIHFLYSLYASGVDFLGGSL